MALDWFHRRGFEFRRCGNYSDCRPHKTAKALGGSVLPAFLGGAEEIFEEGRTTHGDCCCAVENWQFDPVPPFAVTTGNT
jgi:hypothetical protein